MISGSTSAVPLICSERALTTQPKVSKREMSCIASVRKSTADFR